MTPPTNSPLRLERWKLTARVVRLLEGADAGAQRRLDDAADPRAHARAVAPARAGTGGPGFADYTAEGRILCLLLAIYALAVFGYLTAAVAAYFVGKDQRVSAG